MSLHKRLGLSSKETQSEKEVTLKLTKGELEALLIGLGEATFKESKLSQYLNWL